ncbi:MAG: DUF2955 domain-containing protein [Brevundimonas sp.]|nr:MAG: DUF2955 domain-containing protein [Brevundimonas sp.]
MTITQPSGVGAGRTGFSTTDRFMLRMAVAGTLGFAIAVWFGWPISFLAPMLAVKMIPAMPTFPNPLQAAVLPVVMWVSTTAALMVTSLLGDAPFVQLLILGLVIFVTFYAKRRGAPGGLILLLQVGFCIVPLFSTISLELGHFIADFLQRNTVAATATLLISHLLVPALPAATQAAPAAPAPPVRLSPPVAGRVALSDTLVLFPLLAYLLLGSAIQNFVMVMMTITILNELDPTHGHRAAMTMIIGNTVGGLLAIAAQQVVLVADNLFFFLLTVFLTTLWFARGLTRPGPSADLYHLAAGTFMLILGLAVTPLPGGSEQSYLLRILHILIGTLWAVIALVIVLPLRRVPLAPTIAAPAQG